MKIVIRFTTLLTLLALAACGHDSKESTPPPDGGGNNPPPPVVTAPAITTQPASASANEGGTVTFTVVASGDGLSYQWKKNGTAIAGATAASYTTPVLAAGDDQAIYTVTVTNAGGSVTSNNATLTVTTTTPPPTGGGGDDDPLLPLDGPTEPYPLTPAPMAATPTIAGVTGDHRYLLSWDPTSSGIYTFGFLHYSGVETRLYIPVGSFLDEVFLTTADVTDIGPAVTSVVAAVDIEPGDFVTEKTVTANFMIPDSMMATIDPAQLIGFAADSDGSNLHLIPIVVGNFGVSVTRPALKVNRLGIVGIAIATPQQQDALAAAWPTDPEDRLNALLAPSLTAKWRAAVLPASSSVGKHATKVAAAAPADDGFASAAIRGFYNDQVVPAFAAADADVTLIPAATSTALSFLRMAALSGEDGSGGNFQVVAAQVWARVLALQDRYADYIAQQCRDIGGVNEMQKMLGMMRQLQLLGNKAKSDELDEVLPQCSRFKVTFRLDYGRNSNWAIGYTAGDHSGVETIQDQAHVVIEGSHTFGVFDNPQGAELRMTTLEWKEDHSRDDGTVSHLTWASEGGTAAWNVNGISVPVVKTRGGTPSTAATMYLSPFIDVGTNTDITWHPFTATITTKVTNPDGSQAPDRVDVQQRVSLELFVPALPGDGAHNYGPMLIPRSGNATSQRTRTTPYHGGSIVETEVVTLSIERQ